MNPEKNCSAALIKPHHLAATVEALRSNRMDLIAYVDEMCARTAQIDPRLEALLPEPNRRERLRAEATALQSRFANPAERPPLYGILLAVKDIFHLNGFVTRAGSEIPPHLFAGGEAIVVRQLREAGALILGKSVTTEFAYFEPGPTRNPHNLAHTPGGSSSGSAAAVAAGLCGLALGTQTIGSVTRPAAFCGIVGFKPTYNRIPTAGLVYFSRSIDHVGIFTQDMAGMALAASTLCQAWRPLPPPSGLPTLGIPVGPYLEQTEPHALEAFENQISRLEAIGCPVKRIPALADIAQLNHLHRQMIFAEFAREHSAIYAQYAALYRPRTAEIIEIGKKVSHDELGAARAGCSRLRADLEARMTAAEIDLWVCPSACGPAPEGIHATGDPNMNLPWTHAGLPVITLPAGWADNGLPLGLQFIAPFGADELLLPWSQMLADRLKVNAPHRKAGGLGKPTG
jgi:Asp-tRNA(Asn)/Glu-tRNA(Gln) amidotransferase A subunit family amidase